jgi:hypothetical protein
MVRTKPFLIIGVLILVGGATSLQNLQGKSLAEHVQAASAQVQDFSPLHEIGRIYYIGEWPSAIGSAKEKSVAHAQGPQIQYNVVPEQVPEPMFLPAVDHDDIQMKHKIIANEVLMMFPAACRNTLKNFHVRYDNPEHRGLAGRNTMIISGNVPDAEFRALFIHELGHVFDLSEEPDCFGGTKTSGESEFYDGKTPLYNDDPNLDFYRISWRNAKYTRSGVAAADFVSGYAMTDPFEDFAESFAYFMLQNRTFLERARHNEALAQKYAWFVRHMFDGSIPQVATGKHNWNGRMPWDVTKLGYIWHPHTAIAQKN